VPSRAAGSARRPSPEHAQPDSGPAEQCLLLDLSGKFDIVRLMAVLEDRVTSQHPRDAPR